MTILYSSTGLPHSALADSWEPTDLYLDPTETDMEGGNKRLRAEPGNDIERVAFDILYSTAEYATFKTFVRTTLSLGTARFQMQVWNGSAYELRTVQFASKPKPTNIPPKKRVHFDLWLFP